MYGDDDDTDTDTESSSEPSIKAVPAVRGPQKGRNYKGYSCNDIDRNKGTGVNDDIIAKV